MLACTDVHYRQTEAIAACVLFHAWPDDRPCFEIVEPIQQVSPYEPGSFYRRELPCLTAVLRRLIHCPQVIVIDGYVWLGNEAHPGLGAHLYEALGRSSAVVGVAKTHFQAGPSIQEVRRGTSLTPLYVTAVGMDLRDAAEHVQEMHGRFRIPSLIKWVDMLCRRGFILP
jgi:deoxyribonuclease V